MAKNLVGKTLGGYQLDELIGEGGMATVYKGYQRSLNRWVAIKVLDYQEATSLARFQLEAKAVASLRHRNILIVYEYGEEDGLPYIATEYIEGGTLEDRLNGKPMDWRRVIALIIPIAEALHYAHQHNIIHRDVKPSNILMPQEDWPVLADFGLVKRSDDDNSLTQTGTFMGTPSYISPEQARDLGLDPRADMYSLGVIMFELVAGRLPFDYKLPNKILLAHVTEPPPSPRAFNPDCPPELEEVILTMLKKKPQDRYPDMQEVIKALKAVLRAYPAAPPQTTPKPSIDRIEKPELSPQPSGKPLDRLFKPLQKLLKGKPTVTDTTPQDQLKLPSDKNSETLKLPVSDAPGQVTARLVLQDKSAVIVLPDKNTLILGRMQTNNIVDIDLEPYQASKYGVSRRHARLSKRGETWWLDDLHSLNGTFVNNVEVKHGQPVALKDGDMIRFSQMTFTFSFPRPK
jgi:serine/threonine protein kinase